jgi:hypothetical protein
MRTKRLFNFPAFDEVAERARARGFDVLNPAEMDREAGFNPEELPGDWDWNTLPDSFDLKLTIRRDLDAVISCDGYICLEGWEKSVGATAEQKLLVWLGATRLDWATLELWREPVANKSNPKDAFGLQKTPLRLVPPIAVLYLAKAMGMGAKKYGEWNFRKDRPRASVYWEAMWRHLLAGLDGQDLDEESGLPHTAHILANAAILLDAEACGTLIDDRNKSGIVAPLLKKFCESGKNHSLPIAASSTRNFELGNE